jgi:regulatory protein spx
MRQWLIENSLEFKEINVLENSLQKEDLLKILSLTELGVEEIISKRSSIYKKLSATIDFDLLSLNELLDLITQNHKLLRRPLLIDESRLQVGYNEDDIRQFLPRAVRRVELAEAIEKVRMNEIQFAQLLV